MPRESSGHPEPSPQPSARRQRLVAAKLREIATHERAITFHEDAAARWAAMRNEAMAVQERRRAEVARARLEQALEECRTWVAADRVALEQARFTGEQPAPPER